MIVNSNASLVDCQVRVESIGYQGWGTILIKLRFKMIDVRKILWPPRREFVQLREIQQADANRLAKAVAGMLGDRERRERIQAAFAEVRAELAQGADHRIPDPSRVGQRFVHAGGL